MSTPARFLSRWSRLKRQAAVEAPTLPAVLPNAALVLAEGAAPDAGVESGVLPDLTALLREELSDAVRKQALKAIFADPHFNVMDGLDVYIDDYSISDPIPEEMLATLNQARFLFETKEAPEAADEETSADPLGAIKQVAGCDNLHQGGQEVAIDPAVELVAKEK